MTTEPAIAVASLEPLLLEILDALRELEQRRQLSLDEMQQAAVELAVLVASRILQQEIAADRFPLAELVRQAVERLGLSPSITVRLHPQDLRRLNASLESQASGWALPSGVALQADDTMSPGSCLADAGDLGVLTTLEQRLGDVREVLLESIEDAQIERRKARAGAAGVRRFPDRRETA